MFLDLIRRRNPGLVEQSIALHQAGLLPASRGAPRVETISDAFWRPADWQL